MGDDYDLGDYDLSEGSDYDDDDVLDIDPDAKEPLVEAHVLYHASMLLKGTISKIQGLQVPWPPVAADISIENVQEIVTPTLFNFFAWTLGFSDEAQTDSYVAVTEK